MTQEIQRFPLTWPQSWQRTKVRAHSRFKTSPAASRDGLVAEIGRLDGRDFSATKILTGVKSPPATQHNGIGMELA